MLFDRCLRMDHSFSKVKVMSSQGLLNLIKSGRRETGAVSSFKFYYKRKQRTVKRFLLLKKWEK